MLHGTPQILCKHLATLGATLKYLEASPHPSGPRHLFFKLLSQTISEQNIAILSLQTEMWRGEAF